MAIAVLKLTGRPVPFVIEKMRYVILKLTGNLAFPTPVPALAALTGLTDSLETKYQEALTGARDKKALMRIALKELQTAASTLTGYVQSASAGDEGLILSAGFDVKSPRTPVGILPPPVNVRSVFGAQEGDIIVRYGGVRGRLVYKVQMNATPGDESKWVDFTYTGRNRFIANGLESGKLYAFRVASLSAEGLGSYSDPTIHKAL